MEVTNKFKGLDLRDRVPEDLRMEVSDVIQEAVIKTNSKIKAIYVNRLFNSSFMTGEYVKSESNMLISYPIISVCVCVCLCVCVCIKHLSETAPRVIMINKKRENLF